MILELPDHVHRRSYLDRIARWWNSVLEKGAPLALVAGSTAGVVAGCVWSGKELA